MEYAIFPMKTINITQRANNNYSHSGLQAWDMGGLGDGIDYWYAPCRVKVLKIEKYDSINNTGLYNTVFFGSCDENGNKTEVMCEDGVPRVLTFVCTHMDKEGFQIHNLSEGRKIESGQACYQEGFTGGPNMTGIHIHMEVAEGWVYKKIKNNVTGHWEAENITTISDIFYQLSGFNTIGGSHGANGYTFKTVTSRTVSDVVPTKTITGYGLYTSQMGVNIRTSPNTSASVVTLVPRYKELKIKRFLDGFQSDGWQWAETYYNGMEGYSRVETLNSYTVVETSTSVQVPNNNVCVVPQPLYIVMSTKGGYLRTYIPNGTPTFISAGTNVRVLELINTIQSDGYQWVKAEYNGTVGYIQADTHNWHYFKIYSK